MVDQSLRTEGGLLDYTHMLLWKSAKGMFRAFNPDLVLTGPVSYKPPLYLFVP